MLYFYIYQSKDIRMFSDRGNTCDIRHWECRG